VGLKQLWPEDQESIDCLQEIFGYILEPVNDQQKIFLLLGPKRAGKGTIRKVLCALLGDAAITPLMGDFGKTFGLEPLIGKSLAIIPDARLGRMQIPALSLKPY
jgi:putative DNA primase/helicase